MTTTKMRDQRKPIKCAVCGTSFYTLASSRRTCSQDCYETQNIIKAESGCWHWQRKGPTGYGKYSYKPTSGLAHRIMYARHVGRLFNEEVVRHKCDNPICCNPEHLETGSQADNVADMIARGRNNKGEANYNAVLSVEQVKAIFASDARVKTLAEQYGVGTGTISCIRHGYTWSHVTGVGQDIGPSVH